MKLTQLLLCKTPFTPSYEHLVTGCNTTEFYNKLSQEPDTITISPVLNSGIQFRTVRETDREIVIELNMINFEMRPQDYNYIATYEIIPSSRRFWFIESYNVNNSAGYVNVTFYCSIDYWHSYGLESTPLHQNIVRLTQSGSDSRVKQFLSENIDLYHTVEYDSHDRVLWARVRINTIVLVNNPGAMGSSLEGSVPFVYVPVGRVINNKFTYLENTINSPWTYSFTTSLGYEIDIDNFEFRSGLGLSDNIQDGRTVLQHIGNWGFVESASLTYLPPFDYTVNNGTKVIDVGNSQRAKFTFNGLTITTIISDLTEEYSRTITYDVSSPSATEADPNAPFYNRYPIRYYSLFLGDREFKYPYPVTSFKIVINNKCSGDSNVASLFVNNKKVEDNIQITMNIPLTINKDSAGIIEATYGSGYREISALSKLIPHGRDLVSVRFPTPEVILDKLVSNANLVKNYMDFRAEENTPVDTYIPQTTSDSIAFGDYPFIVLHTPASEFESELEKRIDVYGERVLRFFNPIYPNHKYYDYVKTEGAVTFFTGLNARGNDVICSAFNRGVHIWHYDYLTSIQEIGIYKILNPNR